MKRPHLHRQPGFTVLELLIVIGIFGLLAIVILASLNSARDKADIAATRAQLKEVEKAIALLFADTGLYPNKATSICRPYDNAWGLGNETAFTDPSLGIVATDGSYPGWGGPYLNDVPLDPWGTPIYFDEDYRCNTGTIGCTDDDVDAIDDGSSVAVSCGPNAALTVIDGALQCVYDNDNILIRFCDRDP